MSITLWFSKKARRVTETEVNLAKQESGNENFGSTPVSRAIVRQAINMNKWFEKVTPDSVKNFIESRFTKDVAVTEKDGAAFDLIRATVNLTVASLLISLATSLIIKKYRIR